MDEVTEKKAPSRFILRNWGLTVLILVTLAVLAFGVVALAIQSNGQRLEASYWERHALQVQLTGQTLLGTLNKSEADQRLTYSSAP
jgi:hypothetical protein